MRKPIIAGNWKMYNTTAETIMFFDEFLPLVKKYNSEIIICVPFTGIKTAAAKTKNCKVKIGAQNVAWADKGAFTGEISAKMLKDEGALYSIIGHSERRAMFGETDETVNLRVHTALKNEITPIICLGETEQERESGQTDAVTYRQVTQGLRGVHQDDADKIILSYEPVWAIGTGNRATKEDANRNISYIRAVLRDMFGTKTADSIRILYGGSVNKDNITEFMSMPEIDGALVGAASLKPFDFAEIVKAGEFKAQKFK